MTSKEKEDMFIKNKGLIYLAMKKLNISSMFDDFYDIGLIGITKGINTFDVSKGIKEDTYLFKCIYNEIVRSIRLNLKKDLFRKNCLSLNCGYGTELELQDCIPDDKCFENEIEKEDYMNYIYNLTLELKPTHQRIIQKYYGLKTESRTMPKISKEENISYQRTQQIIKTAIKKIKTKILEDDNEIKIKRH